MGKDHYDAILASTPLNATAARVTSRGEHYVPKRPFDQRGWDHCPKTTKRLGHGELDLSGREFGRFTVIGKSLEKGGPKQKQSLWVCRCVCGAYEGRTARAVKNKHNVEDMCFNCRNTKHLRWLDGQAS